MWSLAQTLAIAFLGTLLAAVFALPFGFLAARNVIPNIFAHFIVRRALDTVRAVDTLMLGADLDQCRRIGAFCGNTGDHDVGFRRPSESCSPRRSRPTDSRGVEGVVSTGGRHLQAVRFGLLPQVLPVFLSQILYFFESQYALGDDYRHRRGWRDRRQSLRGKSSKMNGRASLFCVLMILVTVAIIDMISTRPAHCNHRERRELDLRLPRALERRKIAVAPHSSIGGK